MKVSSIVAATILGTSSLGIAAMAIAQDSEDKPAPAAPAATTTPAPAFTPGFADLMSMLIQPRHVKLYYAGMRKNWELAAFEARGLSTAFRRIAQTIPNYRDSGSVDEAVESMMAPAIKAIDAAIAAGDSKQFAKAYGDLTAGCNACHGYMEYPFLVIRVPGADTKNSIYPGQDFSASHP
jgi:hypothetical protein